LCNSAICYLVIALDLYKYREDSLITRNFRQYWQPYKAISCGFPKIPVTGLFRKFGASTNQHRSIGGRYVEINSFGYRVAI